MHSSWRSLLIEGCHGGRRGKFPQILIARVCSILDCWHQWLMINSSLYWMSCPLRPRYGSRQGAKTLSDAANLVHGRFGGSAGAIWEHASPAEVEKTLQEIYGLGSGIAAMATRILHDDFGCFRGQERQIDVKPDVHVVRVFRRTGLTESESGDQAIRAARRLSPAFPGALDWPAWRIGQLWCHAREPQCDACPLTSVCPRRI